MRYPLVVLMIACNADPGAPPSAVDYRAGATGPDSGERGSVKISEILWSGSVTDAGKWDPSDVFVEIRNEGSRPLNVSQWYLEIDGPDPVTVRFPDAEFELEVGEHRFAAAKDSGCFPAPDWVIPALALPANGDAIKITLRDADERLIEPAGSNDMPPFAGGYDLVRSRSMERIQLMFGGEGTSPHSWHFYTDAAVDVPNDDRVAENCRTGTLASPGRPNSPDYSGAFASGSFE